MMRDLISTWIESRKDFPQSEFGGKKAVILIEHGSPIYTWIDTDIDEVLSSPPPLELLNRFGEATKHWPELSQRLFHAFDEGLFSNDARLVEALITTNEFDINRWVFNNQSDYGVYRSNQNESD